jgi:uncharacterized RDD family membrane protein YckC
MQYASPAEAPAYAGFTRRLMAWFIDVAVLTVIRLAVLTMFGLLANLADRSGRLTDEVKTAAGLTFLASLYLCAWPYYAAMESSSAQGTLGKRAMGIRVEDVDGGRATFVQTSVRFFLRLVSALTLGFGFLMIAFTRRRQALHDIAANTIVTVEPRVLQPHHFVRAS